MRSLSNNYTLNNYHTKMRHHCLRQFADCGCYFKSNLGYICGWEFYFVLCAHEDVYIHSLK